MDFIEIAKKRYSVRSYKDKKVEEEKLQKILEEARVAPTAANLQPVRLIRSAIYRHASRWKNWFPMKRYRQGIMRGEGL